MSAFAMMRVDQKPWGIRTKREQRVESELWVRTREPE
jgi:hypothetical protein